MNTTSKLLFPLLLPLLFFSSGNPVFAKSTDNDAPVHIEADQVEIREKDNISIYTGHVKIIKGSIKISGDRIVILNKDGAMHSITINGTPANFYQLNDLNEEISAESMRMEYMASSGLLELKENALLVKNQNRFSSEHIIYDAHNDIVKAGANNKPDPEDAPRVQITIHPSKPADAQP